MREEGSGSIKVAIIYSPSDFRKSLKMAKSLVFQV